MSAPTSPADGFAWTVVLLLQVHNFDSLVAWAAYV